MSAAEKQAISTSHITFFYVAKTFVFKLLKRHLPLPPERKLVPDTIMLHLNEVSKRRCKHLFFAVVRILKRHR